MVGRRSDAVLDFPGDSDEAPVTPHTSRDSAKSHTGNRRRRCLSVLMTPTAPGEVLYPRWMHCYVQLQQQQRRRRWRRWLLKSTFYLHTEPVAKSQSSRSSSTLSTNERMSFSSAFIQPRAPAPLASCYRLRDSLRLTGKPSLATHSRFCLFCAVDTPGESLLTLRYFTRTFCSIKRLPTSLCSDNTCICRSHKKRTKSCILLLLSLKQSDVWNGLEEPQLSFCKQTTHRSESYLCDVLFLKRLNVTTKP